MKNIARLAAAAAYLAAAAEARNSFLARNNAERSWQPAQETATPASVPVLDVADDLAHMPQLALHRAAVAEPPATTAAPLFANHFKRDSTDNTCGYISGNSSLSLYCDTTQACYSNSNYLMVGCCPDTSSTNCHIPTTCYPSSEGSLYTTSNGYTLFCDESSYPECVTYYYADEFLTGYSLLGCGKFEAVAKIYYTPTEASSSSSTSTSSTSTSSTSTTTTSSTTTSASSSASTTGGGGGGGSGGSKSNTGAIVGGVVGGVAGLALIALGAFFLIRRNNNKKVNNVTGGAAAGAAAAPGAGGPPAGGTPPMAQPQQPYYGAGAAAYQYPNQDPNQYPQQQAAKVYDPYNPASQQYDPNAAAGSAPGSPPLVQGPQSAYHDASASPLGHNPEAASAGGHISPNEAIAPYNAPAPAAGMGFHSGPIPTTLDVAELPTERGHGELRELA